MCRVRFARGVSCPWLRFAGCGDHARADEAEIRIIAELGVWRGFGAPEPWRQRLNVSAGGQGDEWERIWSEVLREVRRKTKGN